MTGDIDGHNERVDGRVDEHGERIEERLRAVERAITDDDRAVADLADGATAAAERDALRERVSEIESRVGELEAATQAVRGYVGSVRAVNREVERRADLALAAATEARTSVERRDGREGALQDDRSAHDPTVAVPDDPTVAAPDDPAVAAAVPDDQGPRPADDVREDESAGPDRSESPLGSETLSRLREVL